MARQRLAEEKLAGERRAARFWREQAETAEQDAGVLQTRAAAAEVQRESIFHCLELERKRAKESLAMARTSMDSKQKKQEEVFESEKERCRRLEFELEKAKLALAAKYDENQSLQVQMHEVSVRSHKPERKKLGIMSKKKKQDAADDHAQDEPYNVGLLSNTMGSSATMHGETHDLLTTETVLTLKQKASDLKMQFELFRSFTCDQLKQLPESGNQWGVQLNKVLTSANSEKDWFKERLAVETSLRRTLSHQVLDYRGTVRVFCRPRPSLVQKTVKAIQVPSNATLVLNRIRTLDGEVDCTPLGFEFDHVFRPESSQRDVYDEIESLVLDSLEGFSVCVIAYGQSLSGKSHTLTGQGQNTDEKGLFFIAIDEIFSISQKRSERYQDSFTLTMLEVQEERLNDLLHGTPTALKCGEQLTTEVETNRKKNKHDRMEADDGLSAISSSRMKLEIKSNIDGDTVVQGLTSVPIKSPEDVHRIWNECDTMRQERPAEESHTAQSKTHAFYTIDVVSTNIATGVSTAGKLQFVDLASADRVTLSGDNTKTECTNQRDLDFVNKSLNTLNAVVDAKRQFTRSVPFRNSTLTHLLRDPFEGDSKVLLLCCIKSGSEDFEQTRESLRFAAKIRKVAVGVATKRTLSLTGR
jgi:kinesin family protein C2/C3